MEGRRARCSVLLLMDCASLPERRDGGSSTSTSRLPMRQAERKVEDHLWTVIPCCIGSSLLKRLGGIGEMIAAGQRAWFASYAATLPRVGGGLPQMRQAPKLSMSQSRALKPLTTAPTAKATLMNLVTSSSKLPLAVRVDNFPPFVVGARRDEAVPAAAGPRPPQAVLRCAVRGGRSASRAANRPCPPPGCTTRCCRPRCTSCCCDASSCRATSSGTQGPWPWEYSRCVRPASPDQSPLSNPATLRVRCRLRASA